MSSVIKTYPHFTKIFSTCRLSCYLLAQLLLSLHLARFKLFHPFSARCAREVWLVVNVHSFLFGDKFMCHLSLEAVTEKHPQGRNTSFCLLNPVKTFYCTYVAYVTVTEQLWKLHESNASLSFWHIRSVPRQLCDWEFRIFFLHKNCIVERKGKMWMRRKKSSLYIAKCVV